MPKSEFARDKEKSFKNDSFSPLFLAGMLGRNLPHQPVDFALQKITDNLCKNHPAVLKRLAPLNGKSFLIKPRDLPYKIRLEFEGEKIFAHLDKGNDEPADVWISGTLSSLISMLNGDEDGDALFFSRKIAVEGDTEALLTLRNAIDSDDIDLLSEINDGFGIFKRPVSKLVDVTSAISEDFDRDLNQLNKALIDPLLIRLAAQEQQIMTLNEKLMRLEKENQKVKKSIQSLKKKR